MVASAFAFIAFAAVAALTRSDLDGTEIAFTLTGVMLTGVHIALDCLILFGERHRVHLPFL